MEVSDTELSFSLIVPTSVICIMMVDCTNHIWSVVNLHHFYDTMVHCTNHINFDGQMFISIILNQVHAGHRPVCGWFLKIVSMCTASAIRVYRITLIIKLSLRYVLILFREVSQSYSATRYMSVCVCVCLHVCASTPKAINNQWHDTDPI